MDLKVILKGFIVGIGKIIPGVSGSMLAITLGLYEKILDAVTCFFDDPKEHFKLLVNFGIGVFLAIILFSKIILFCLSNYYSETMYLFLGLIVGTMIPFVKKVNFKKKNLGIGVFCLLLFFWISQIGNFRAFVFTGSIFNYVYVAFLGMVDAFTSIIPGISGTAIYMLLGVYEFVLNLLANPFSFLFVIYAIGMILGIILVCKLMNYLFKTRKEETLAVILALMVGSLTLLLVGLVEYLNVYLIIIFGIGVVGGILFD